MLIGSRQACLFLTHGHWSALKLAASSRDLWASSTPPLLCVTRLLWLSQPP